LADAKNQQINFSNTPLWTKSYPLDLEQTVPLADIEEGIYFRLVESQIKHVPSQPYEMFIRRAMSVVSAQGMEYSSSFNVDFDPSFQRVELHEINVIRNQQVIDKKSSVRVSVIQREKRMEALIYDGALTVNVIIDDVRVGDTVKYSYSRIGRNPIYGNDLSFNRQVNYSVPVQQLNVRLLTDKNNPLNSKLLNTDLTIEKSILGSLIEYSIRDKNIQALRYEENTPSWFDPYGQVQLTEFKNWGEVANWTLPLYDRVITVNSEINKIADDIKSEYSSASDQISAALQFVQNEIRYLGIENGLSSHMPSSVLETLVRRYGDCKDKAVLFISILKALDIQAFPALVNTKMGPVLDALLPSNNVFDHVIVKVVEGGQSYWLDPTSRFQLGSLDDISESNFGFSLVVKPGVVTLENMTASDSKSSGFIYEKFDLTGGVGSVVRYRIKSTYHEGMAEDIRYDLVSDSVAGTQKKYIDFYKRFYPDITVETQLSSAELLHDVVIEEDYLISNFWDRDESSQGDIAKFYANDISTRLIRADSNERVSPYYMGKKYQITQVIEISLGEGDWGFEDESVKENNDIFDFEYQSKFDSDTSVLLLSFNLNLKKEYVDSHDYERYLEKRDKIIDLLSYRIIKYFDVAPASSEQINWSERITLYFMIYLLVMFIVAIVVWIIERNIRPKDDSVIFHPVSLEKFYFFSVLTFNLYLVYWAYKNWVYIKVHMNDGVMPLWRALFQSFWFYSFNRYFQSDSEERFEKNKVYSNIIAVVLLVSLLLLSIAQSGPLFICALFIAPLIYFKYVNYINLINDKEGLLYKHNSQWSWRQGPVLLLCAPLLIVSILGSFYLIPSSNIERGSRIWSHDLRFMQRQGVVPIDEKIEYFFSNDFWSIRADGNGFTENRVFSYWNENDQLTVEQSDYSDIKNIEVKYPDSFASDTIVTVSRMDDSTFLLFLSGEKSKDMVFVRKMRMRWQTSKAKKAGT
jgi:transglutaminase-like putative cysteine protease